MKPASEDINDGDDSLLRLIIAAPTNDQCDSLICRIKREIGCEFPAIRVNKDILDRDEEASSYNLFNLASEAAEISIEEYRRLNRGISRLEHDFLNELEEGEEVRLFEELEDEDYSPLRNRKFREAVNKLLKRNVVWVITPTLCMKGLLRIFIGDAKISIRAVILDEACQASEIHLLMTQMYGCRTLIQVGDPCQLQPHVSFNNEIMRISNMQRLMAKGSVDYALLDKQYRTTESKKDNESISFQFIHSFILFSFSSRFVSFCFNYLLRRTGSCCYIAS